ncbi:2OG-Fe(II) oxygenase family protein [Sphingomonas sp.]|uniref:2OG-Fe(II) oxygenase family protein n=1 Tax=Sphingomonas sp. TaxID=28214 RepID=UPI002E3701B3|nr:2OG-Fe(II) oxygenase family protein [Sphingomonas sp.]HEX4694423.1 2OG-Fe(II) oxygenase family protein [Sphingomonas sp.]
MTVPDAITLLSLEIYRVATTFFSKPEQLKRLDACPQEFQGWRSLGGEFSVVPERPDLHESFWVTGTDGDHLFSRFSSEARRLHELLADYARQISGLERLLTAEIMRSLGVDGHASFECVSRSDIQCLFYRPSTHQDREFLQEEHEDAVYMTLTKADAPGLEVECKGGSYRPLSLQPNQIAVLPGEILSLMTGGFIRPLMHRVVRNASQEVRTTIGYFLAPTAIDGGKIEPWISNAFNASINLEQRVRDNQVKFLVRGEGIDN